ncbi:hypothetical protein [Ramlibacter sp.]|uniref:hypothetical protein n=1 Tax=Ramlibacter sp. TaxID=1917967 RepID=UPI002B5FE58B|nr:hypothetical protein [Ramlibacter sp.]HWI82462.1 hypothetical protein [Ramlibacter sp.]
MIRFSTVAANADFLGEDAPDAAAPAGPAGAPRTDRDGQPRRREGGRARDAGSAKPGSDINQAGFLKDKDANKPS